MLAILAPNFYVMPALKRGSFYSPWCLFHHCASLYSTCLESICCCIGCSTATYLFPDQSGPVGLRSNIDDFESQLCDGKNRQFSSSTAAQFLSVIFQLQQQKPRKKIERRWQVSASPDRAVVVSVASSCLRALVHDGIETQSSLSEVVVGEL